MHMPLEIFFVLCCLYATQAQSYIGAIAFTGPKCAEGADYMYEFTAVDLCQPSGETSMMFTANETDYTVTEYFDSTCTGEAAASMSHPLNTCLTFTDYFNDVVSVIYSSVDTVAAPYKNAYQAAVYANCSDLTTPISSTIYNPSACISSGDTSAIYPTCNSTLGTVYHYNDNTCPGKNWESYTVLNSCYNIPLPNVGTCYSPSS